MTDQFSWMVFLVRWKYGKLKNVEIVEPVKVVQIA
jgi:hypothetical protein